METLKADRQFQRKQLDCPERNSNPRSLAYMTGVLTTRQLSVCVHVVWHSLSYKYVGGN